MIRDDMKLVLLDILPENLRALEGKEYRFYGEHQWFCEHLENNKTKTFTTHETDIDVLDINSDYIIDDLRKSGFDGENTLIVMGTESATQVVSKLTGELNIRGLSPSQVPYFRDKYKMYEHSLSIGFLEIIPTVKAKSFYDSELIETASSFVFKPIDGCASEGIHYIEEGDAVPSELIKDGYIAQKKIEGDIIHVDGVWNGKDIFLIPFKYLAAPSNWRSGRDVYSSYRCDVEFENDIKLFLASYFGKLNVDKSSFHLEIILEKNTGKPYFLEIGARPGGGPIADTISKMIERNYKEFLINFISDVEDSFPDKKNAYYGWLVYPNEVSEKTYNEIDKLLKLTNSQHSLTMKNHISSDHVPNWHPGVGVRIIAGTPSSLETEELMMNIAKIINDEEKS